MELVFFSLEFESLTLPKFTKTEKEQSMALGEMF